jgi:hypothetical protein
VVQGECWSGTVGDTGRVLLVNGAENEVGVFWWWQLQWVVVVVVVVVIDGSSVCVVALVGVDL